MDPMTAVTSGFAAGHHAISLLKGITQAIQASGKSQVLTDLIELQTAMLDILAKQQELTLQAAELHARLRELQAEAALARELVFEDHPGVYWLTRNGKKDGPYCPVCWDKDKKLIHLHDARNRGAACPWLCMVCQGEWGDPV